MRESRGAPPGAERRGPVLGLVAMVLLGLSEMASAQTPFVNDDAEVATHHHWHFELYNRYDTLSGAAAPADHQNTTNFDVKFGFLENLEAGFDFPLIGIFNTGPGDPPNAYGLGDLDFSAKYILAKERPDSAWPAFALVLAVEIPTGNRERQLGSGRTDVGLNTISQKRLAPNLVLKFNLGVLFTGDTTTGAEGIHAVRSLIFTGGSELVFSPKKGLDLGVEVWGAQAGAAIGSRNELRIQVGGSRELREGMAFDMAIGAGWFSSPHFGIQIGISLDL
jgi:hypothetical protein